MKPQEVFENEDAEKLLDYFVAYKKLNEIAEFFRCAAKVNHEVRIHGSTSWSIELTDVEQPEVKQLSLPSTDLL